MPGGFQERNDAEPGDRRCVGKRGVLGRGRAGPCALCPCARGAARPAPRLDREQPGPRQIHCKRELRPGNSPLSVGCPGRSPLAIHIKRESTVTALVIQRATTTFTAMH